MRVSNKINSENLNYIETRDSVEFLTSLFYQSRFSQIVGYKVKVITTAHEYAKVKLLKSKALFELNRKDESFAVVNEILSAGNSECNPDFIFVKASLYYFLKEYDKSLELFKSSLEINQGEAGRFKSLLGLGNLAYSQNRLEDAKLYLRELKDILIEERIDFEISRLHLEANIFMSEKSQLIRVNELLEISYRKALEQGWSFFCQRTLYLMAKLNQLLGKSGEAIGMLKVLDMQLQFSDSRFLATLVNEEFEKINFKASNNVELDLVNKMVLIGNEDKFFVKLDRWPILFKFIELLHGSGDFISKELIAATLWDGQKYNPRTHDPRIYDLVKRVKKQFEQVEHNPLRVEVHLGGYRLNFS
jgi:tetratricopeptide (TPR) repeat protein